MGNVTRLKTPESVQTFDADTALRMVQSLHRHLRLKPLLQLFQRETMELMPLTGMRYLSPAQVVLLSHGETSEDYVSYTIRWHDKESLGELFFFFSEPQSDNVLKSTEDLVALLASPLNNALLYENALSAPAASAVTPAQNSEEAITPAPEVQRTDTLLLISLDSYDRLLSKNGVAWAQAVLQSVQQEVRTGLREADGVFQIDDGLLALLLPRTGYDAATRVAGKVRELISNLQLTSEVSDQELTACIGIAISREVDDAESVLERAEDALATARKEGPGALHVSG